MQRLEEELVEFAIEQRPIKERVAEHEPVAAEPGLSGEPNAKPGTRRPAMNDLNFQLTPVDCSVSIRPSAQACVARQGVAGDQPSAVVADHRDLAEVEQIDGASQAVDVVLDRQRGLGGELAGTCTGQVDEMAGDMVGQMGEQRAEGGPADRPSMDEQHVGSVADPAVGHLAGTDVEERVGAFRKRSAAVAAEMLMSYLRHRTLRERSRSSGASSKL